MLKINEVVNDTYQVTGYVGSGGGGIVYKARHLRLETDVVIKQIREEVKDKIYLRQEADILKNLKHPYLPRVYDFLMTEDGVYTVMDYVPGKPLDKLLEEQGRIPQDQALRWLNQLAEALAYLHELDPPVIHSDIKPANIIITPEGNATLIDFNVSICIDDADKFSVGISAGYAPPEQYRDLTTYQRITNVTNTRNTKVEQVFSTITANVAKTVYLYEPEQKQEEHQHTELLEPADRTEILPDPDRTELLDTGADRTEILPHGEKTGQKERKIRSRKPIVDTRSDVYSLGCVLYHILTGQAPALDFNEIVPVKQLVPDISEGVALVLEKMMRLLPDERYQNGKEALQAIRSCYKLDSRYVSMKRKERLFALAAVAAFVAGAVLITLGIRTIQREEDAFYEESLLQADTLAAGNQYRDAIDIALDMENRYPGRLKAYEREAYYLYKNLAYEDAIARVEEVFAGQLVVDDGKPDTGQLIGNLYYILARSYYEIEEYADAQLQIEAALTYLPSNAEVYRDAALIRVKNGDPEGAQQLLDSARELGLEEASVNYAAAEIAACQGDYETASGLLQKVLAAGTDGDTGRRAVLLLSRVYREQKDYKAEIALLTDAVGNADYQQKLIYKEYLAAAYVSYAQTEEADRQECLQKALELFEEIKESGYVTFQINENIAILLEETDHYEMAKEQLLNMKEEYPDNYRVYKRLAVLEADIQQQKENAQRDYREMKQYYDEAVTLYEQSHAEDAEMQTLKVQMQDVIDGGWLLE